MNKISESTETQPYQITGDFITQVIEKNIKDETIFKIIEKEIPRLDIDTAVKLMFQLKEEASDDRFLEIDYEAKKELENQTNQLENLKFSISQTFLYLLTFSAAFNLQNTEFNNIFQLLLDNYLANNLVTFSDAKISKKASKLNNQEIKKIIKVLEPEIAKNTSIYFKSKINKLRASLLKE